MASVEDDLMTRIDRFDPVGRGIRLKPLHPKTILQILLFHRVDSEIPPGLSSIVHQRKRSKTVTSSRASLSYAIIVRRNLSVSPFPGRCKRELRRRQVYVLVMRYSSQIGRSSNQYSRMLTGVCYISSLRGERRRGGSMPLRMRLIPARKSTRSS